METEVRCAAEAQRHHEGELAEEVMCEGVWARHGTHHGEGLAADGVGETGSDGDTNTGAAQAHALKAHSCAAHTVEHGGSGKLLGGASSERCRPGHAVVERKKEARI